MAEPNDLSAQLNGMLGGWNTGMGLRWLKATIDECIGELVVGPQHLQPYGIVHGGVHTGIIEAAPVEHAAANTGEFLSLIVTKYSLVPGRTT